MCWLNKKVSCEILGGTEGEEVGTAVGLAVGARVGNAVRTANSAKGAPVEGCTVGEPDGNFVGTLLVGDIVGLLDTGCMLG